MMLSLYSEGCLQVWCCRNPVALLVSSFCINPTVSPQGWQPANAANFLQQQQQQQAFSW
jgi:hypothetical protein